MNWHLRKRKKKKNEKERERVLETVRRVKREGQAETERRAISSAKEETRGWVAGTAGRG